MSKYTEITREGLAAMLNGRQYGSEITKEEERMARDAGLVVVFGYSDDNVEFRGAISDEASCWQGREVLFTDSGFLSISDEEAEVLEKFRVYDQAIAGARKIKAIWCDEEGDSGGYCWRYETEIPHAAFDILEDGEKFCRGIVFNL